MKPAIGKQALTAALIDGAAARRRVFFWQPSVAREAILGGRIIRRRLIAWEWNSEDENT